MHDATQELWNQLGGRLRRFVRTRVADPATVDDIVQDVMLRVHARLSALPPNVRPSAWVFGIARNAVVDHYRSRAVRDHADLDAIDVAAAPTDADRQTALRALTPCLLKMVDRLPEPYRRALRLADLDGLAQQAVAARLGLSLSGAKSRVQRARQQLHRMILDCCHVDQDARGNIIDYHPTERSSRYCGDVPSHPECDSRKKTLRPSQHPSV